MNSRAMMLAETTLKIIIAVIVMVFLIYFLTSLYFNKVNSEKLVQAEQILKASPESLEAKINNLENKNPEEAHLVNPLGWYLFGFVENPKPNACVGKNCLCICEDAFEWFGLNPDAQQEKCDEEGTCLVVENLKKFVPIEIDKQFIFIKKEGGQVAIVLK